MEIVWWIVFGVFYISMPLAKAIAHACVDNRATNAEQTLYFILHATGLLAAASSPYALDIAWYWSVIFLPLAFFSYTIALLIGIFGVWILWGILIFTSILVG